MFLIIISILFSLWIFHKLYSPKTKPNYYYSQTPEVHGTYVFHCNQLTGFQSVMNLGKDLTGSALEYFAYKDMQLFIRFKSGATFTGSIDMMEARYDISKKGIIYCSLTCENQTATITAIWKLFSDDDWYNMFNLLTHCKTTKNAKSYIDYTRTFTSKERYRRLIPPASL